jgi:hypothetical protein
MERSLLITLVVLVALTFVSALFSSFGESGARWIPLAIMGLAAMKFVVVAFRFMELQKAHVFWRASMVVISVLLAVLVGTMVP